MIIRVDPSLLESEANQIQGIGQDISSLIKGLVSATQGAPSYNGQFGPRVAEIGSEAGVKSGALSNPLNDLGERLGLKGVEFANVDDAAISGFDNIIKVPVNWVDSFPPLSEYFALLDFFKKYLSLGNLIKGNGAVFSLSGLFAMIFGSNQMWGGWTFFSTERPAWWPGWLPWSSPNSDHVVSPIPENESASQPKVSFGDLSKESPQASSSQQSKSTSTFTTPATNSTSTTNTSTTPASTTNNSYDVYYNVPAETQGNLNEYHGCSATTVSMLTDYYHNQNGALALATPQQLQAPLGNSGNNIAMSDMSGELSKLGYKASWTFNGDPPGKVVTMSDLQSALKDGPVAVVAKVKLVGTSGKDGAIDGAGSYAHALVVKGYNKDNVVVNDPWSGKEMQIPDSTFGQMWSGGSNAIFVVRPS